MKDLASCFLLLLLLALPFAALVSDALGRTRNRMLPVATGVAALSWQLAFFSSGLHPQPLAAAVFAGAFYAWPVLLLVAKGWNPGLSWRSIWLSVPVMSWYLIHLGTEFSDRSRRGAGPALDLLLGWLPMFVLFLPLLGLFLGGRAILRSLRKGHRTDARDFRF